ncbi:MAG: hypothetical protein JNK40_10340 [Chromatiales bacterium]|nr:hypothetical protein [Chromatiales bacterium]
MEQDLLGYLLATFPRTAPPSRPENDDDCLVIHGYRVPFESPVDEVMLGILAEFRRNGFRGDSVSGIDRG